MLTIELFLECDPFSALWDERAVCVAWRGGRCCRGKVWTIFQHCPRECEYLSIKQRYISLLWSEAGGQDCIKTCTYRELYSLPGVSQLFVNLLKIQYITWLTEQTIRWRSFFCQLQTQNNKIYIIYMSKWWEKHKNLSMLFTKIYTVVFQIGV